MHAIILTLGHRTSNFCDINIVIYFKLLHRGFWCALLKTSLSRRNRIPYQLRSWNVICGLVRPAWIFHGTWMPNYFLQLSTWQRVLRHYYWTYEPLILCETVLSIYWILQVYYVYGFMLLVFIILTIVTVCVTIVGTYFLLNAENYHWQWTSFMSAASTCV